MLQNTFCHISGLGDKSEKKLWDMGIESWSTLLKSEYLPFSSKKSSLIVHEIYTSFKKLKENNSLYFSQFLPVNQHWRLFSYFKNSVAYLDIETTGLSNLYDHITTISLYDGKEVFYFVHGKNLNDFKKAIKNYSLIVTYNGKCFDVPFIEKYFRTKLNVAHIDLRFILKSLGYSGGLKGCERQFNINRKELVDIDGFMAVFLWKEYRDKGNENALETLLAYNIQDVLSLELLMIHAYNLKITDYNFMNVPEIRIPKNQPTIPFEVDVELVKKLKESFTFGLKIFLV